MAPHSNTLAWKLPWMEEPGGLQSVGSLRVGHDWATSFSLSLSLFTFTFHFHALEKEMATPLQCSCLENPRDGAWWAAIYGVTQSRTRLSSSRDNSRIWRKKRRQGELDFSLLQDPSQSWADVWRWCLANPHLGDLSLYERLITSRGWTLTCACCPLTSRVAFEMWWFIAVKKNCNTGNPKQKVIFRCIFFFKCIMFRTLFFLLLLWT